MRPRGRSRRPGGATPAPGTLHERAGPSPVNARNFPGKRRRTRMSPGQAGAFRRGLHSIPGDMAPPRAGTRARSHGSGRITTANQGRFGCPPQPGRGSGHGSARDRRSGEDEGRKDCIRSAEAGPRPGPPRGSRPRIEEKSDAPRNPVAGAGAAARGTAGQARTRAVRIGRGQRAPKVQGTCPRCRARNFRDPGALDPSRSSALYVKWDVQETEGCG